MPNARHILLVDDEPYITTILAAKFRAGGDEVRIATDGNAGFTLAGERVPDLIVTDYQMPGGDGYGMAVRLREHAATANVPIIMLTARGHHLSAEQLAATNIKRLLQKPFSAREVLTHALELTTGNAGQPTNPNFTPPVRGAA